MKRFFGKWSLLMILSAFAGMISFFQVDSDYGDTHKFNSWFIVVGVLFVLLAIYGLIKFIKENK